MTPDTPLPEVAHLLPQEAASWLSERDSFIQTSVLTQLRILVVFWESHGHVFDPIVYEGIINALVPSLAAMNDEILRLRRENERLRALVGGLAASGMLSVRGEAN